MTGTAGSIGPSTVVRAALPAGGRNRAATCARSEAVCGSGSSGLLALGKDGVAWRSARGSAPGRAVAVLCGCATQRPTPYSPCAAPTEPWTLRRLGGTPIHGVGGLVVAVDPGAVDRTVRIALSPSLDVLGLPDVTAPLHAGAKRRCAILRLRAAGRDVCPYTNAAAVTTTGARAASAASRLLALRLTHRSHPAVSRSPVAGLRPAANTWADDFAHA